MQRSAGARSRHSSQLAENKHYTQYCFRSSRNLLIPFRGFVSNCVGAFATPLPFFIFFWIFAANFLPIPGKDVGIQSQSCKVCVVSKQKKIGACPFYDRLCPVLANRAQGIYTLFKHLRASSGLTGPLSTQRHSGAQEDFHCCILMPLFLFCLL